VADFGGVAADLFNNGNPVPEEGSGERAAQHGPRWYLRSVARIAPTTGTELQQILCQPIAAEMKITAIAPINLELS
jgi:hypothetical protein